MRSLVIGLFIGAFASPALVQAQAEDQRWQGNEDRKLDTQSVVQIAAGQYRVWMKYFRDLHNYHLLQQEDFDCTGRRWRLIHTAVYELNGNPRIVVDSTTGLPRLVAMDLGETATWKPVVPSSEGESDLQLVCSFVRAFPENVQVNARQDSP